MAKLAKSQIVRRNRRRAIYQPIRRYWRQKLREFVYAYNRVA